MYINRMAAENKMLLARIEPKQRAFLDRVRKGVRGHLVRQCLDIGEALADLGLLDATGLNLTAARRVIARGSRQRTKKVKP